MNHAQRLATDLLLISTLIVGAAGCGGVEEAAEEAQASQHNELLVPCFYYYGRATLAEVPMGVAPSHTARVGAMVYWSHLGNIYRVSSCRAAQTLCTNCGARALRSDGTYVWYVDADSHTLKRLTIASGARQTLTSDSALDLFSKLEVGSSDIFFLANGALKRVAKSGGSVTTLVPANLLDFATDGSYLYTTGAAIRRMSLSGQNATTLVASAPTSDNLVIGGNTLYWQETTAGRIRKVAKSGGSPATVWSSADRRLKSLAVDGTYLFFISRAAYGDSGPRRIHRTTLSTGATSTMYSDASIGGAIGLLADGSAIYWADRQGIKRSSRVELVFKATLAR